MKKKTLVKIQLSVTSYYREHYWYDLLYVERWGADNSGDSNTSPEWIKILMPPRY